MYAFKAISIIININKLTYTFMQQLHFQKYILLKLLHKTYVCVHMCTVAVYTFITATHYINGETYYTTSIALSNL